ncbi:MAG: hypothetical protein K9N46_16265 [Candidatus Marinimicrobia bacterium]|nr:hypothetical protein [Candidatus Neomarinimicrobiota bacterium]MCF7830259.1 hypothetical protein [Candidatus Neomarinimicrobiota bacterium]MCF7882286.1 hypothetical protein [Candidatus Neomarinimicrobiota bacterium]
MRRVSELVYLALGIFLITSAGLAQDLEISGQYRGEFEVRSADSSYAHQQWLNLYFDKSLGQDAGMHLDVELNSYGTNSVTPLFQEAYVDYYTDYIDWRFGKQVISWGSAYQLNPTSYFNPYDLTIINPGEKRMGVIAASARYYGPQRIEIAGAITPFHSTHQLPPGSERMLLAQTAAQVTQGLNQSVPGITISPDPNNPYSIPVVPSTLEKTSGGFQVTKRGLWNFDVSLSGYHGYGKFFGVDEEATGNSITVIPGQPNQTDPLATVYFYYPEVNRVGLDIIGTLGDAGIWVEGIQNRYTNDHLDNAFSVVGGADYRFANDLYLVGQGLYIQGRSEDEDDVTALMIHGTKTVFGFHGIELTGLYDLESESYFLQPQFNYSLGNAVALEFGGTLVHLNNAQYGSLFSEMIGDRVYGRLTVDF